ncbi:MAG TPA: hypothetical protein VK610_04140, partial [Rhodothermales bacterium]|nr:hypothetical protein [Rhodothermales bacterium]
MCRHHAPSPVPHGPRLRRADSLAHGAAHDHDHAQWTRRDFLINAGLGAAAGALVLAGAPARAIAPSPFMDALAGLETDRILVLIQLAGGNDGLNTVVPVTNDLYYQKRPTLALPASQTVPLTADFGLHPSMAPLQSRWGAGQLAIVHGVGYPGPDLSHFRGTDIWMTASDGTRSLPATGWAGRTAEALYPGLDTSPPTDPPAVQIGASTPLLFAGDGGRRAVALTDPALIEQIAANGTIYDPGDVPATAYGQELAFIRTIANDSFRYLGAMHAAASQATNSATYPDNRFGASLAAAARFIKGG